MRKILFVVVLTLGLASVLWHVKNRSLPTLTPSEVVSEEVIKQEVHHERHQQLIAPHHTEHLKSEEIKAGGIITANKIAPAQTTDNESEDEEYETLKRSSQEILKILENKKTNPDSEFAAAKPADFSTWRGGTYSGYYQDTLNNISIAIFFDDAGKLSELTCIQMPDGQFTLPPKLELRFGSEDTLLVKVDQKYYIRMGQEHRGKTRYNIGKLYEKTGSSWQFVKDFEAVENHVKKILDPCEFK